MPGRHLSRLLAGISTAVIKNKKRESRFLPTSTRICPGTQTLLQDKSLSYPPHTQRSTCSCGKYGARDFMFHQITSRRCPEKHSCVWDKTSLLPSKSHILTYLHNRSGAGNPTADHNASRSLANQIFMWDKPIPIPIKGNCRAGEAALSTNGKHKWKIPNPLQMLSRSEMHMWGKMPSVPHSVVCAAVLPNNENVSQTLKIYRTFSMSASEIQVLMWDMAPTTSIEAEGSTSAASPSNCRNGGSHSKIHQMSGVPPWIDDPNKPFWVDALIATLDDTGPQQNTVVPGISNKAFLDLRREFQALCVCGNVQKAVDVLSQMEHQGKLPLESDYLCLLKACGKKKALSQTKQVQVHLAQHSSKLSTFLGEYLVIALVKCGAYEDAFVVFETLQRRTVYSWTVLITACADTGKSEKALDLYWRMRAEGVEANEFTFVSLFKACGSTRNLRLGKDLHADARRKGFLADVFVGSTLVSMYGKCGDIVQAESVFAQLVHRNVVSWNAMLSAYVDQGQVEKALEFFERMKEEGVTPKEATYVITLQACSLLGEKEVGVVIDGQTLKKESLRIGKALHAELKRKGFQMHPFVGSSLVNMYGKCGGILEAESVFRGLFQHDVVSWTSILAAYVVQGQGEKVIELYKQMQREGTSPDEHTLVMALQGCCLLADKEAASVVDGQTIRQESLSVGRSLHDDARRRGFEPNVFVASSLVMMYSKCGDIVEAENVFDRLTHLDNVAWNSMLSAYVDQGQGEKAVKLFKQMNEEGACLDDVTLVCVLQACSETGEVEVCAEIHFSIVSGGCQLSLLLTSLIHAYGSCARMVDAQEVFDAFCRPDAVIWSTLIAGFCREGNSVASLQSFEAMQLACIQPDRVTFLSLLSACSHDGLVNQGLEFFNFMSNCYGLSLEVKHLVSLFDLLGRAGDFRRLKGILTKMPAQSDVAVWLCLLAACRNHGNVEMGKFSFDCAVQLQPREAAAYVLMSNIYVDAGMFDSASQVDTYRQEVGAWESPYQSWLDVHSFMSLQCNIPELECHERLCRQEVLESASLYSR